MFFSADRSLDHLQAADGGGAGGPNLLFILVVVAFIVIFLVLPMRRQRKMRNDLQQRQNAMGPGTRVMTQFGLFGTVVSMDHEAKTAVLEIAPNTQVTVHLQVLTTVLDENGFIPNTPEAARAAAERGTVDADTAGPAAHDGEQGPSARDGEQGPAARDGEQSTGVLGHAEPWDADRRATGRDDRGDTTINGEVVGPDENGPDAGPTRN